jgi:2-amino-4-hydroxy-6-hydroxymethyldihydropteridine diphosphokinase
MTLAVLSLGSNMGESAFELNRAFDGLCSGGLADAKISSFHKTSPVGMASGTPDFLNAAVTGEWAGSAEELLDLCQKLETEAGRPRVRAKCVSRALDMDIILFGYEIIKSARLIVPHPGALKRLFVLGPLAEISPDAVFPGENITAAEALHLLTKTNP